jgi:hypothetical protein
MSKYVLTVAWYRFRVTFRRRWPHYLAIVLLIGLVGGPALGAIAAARRTQSSFSIFLANTNPSDLNVGTALYEPPIGITKGYNGSLIHAIAHLPDVKRAESYALVYALPLGANGRPTPAARKASLNLNVLGSVNGLYFNEDRVTVIHGRMADPNKANQIMMTQSAASVLDLKVGQTLPWAVYPSELSNSTKSPYLRSDLTLVGTVVFNNSVVQDEIDANGAPTALLTPAFTRRLTACCADITFTYLRLRHGSNDVATVESEIERILPTNLPHDFLATSIEAAKADQALKPEAIALGAFGGIALLALLLIAGQMIGRQLRSRAEEERVLRSIGAGPAMIVSDGIIGITGAVVVGTLVAGAVAVATSPLAPLGPVRPVYPFRGLSFDWTVLGFGTLALVVVLFLLGLLLASRGAPHRLGVAGQRRSRRESKVAAAASSGGLPISAVVGIRFALEPGADNAPVRSATLGATLAVVVIIATVVFGSSFNALISHPALYGWNWTYELDGGGGLGDIPLHRAAVLLDHDRQVVAWSGYYFANLEVDGYTVPVLGGTPRSPVAPPLLTGHGLMTPGQIVLGVTTLAQIHKVVGDTVTVSYGTTSPTRLLIVGTATLPAVGVSGVGGHLEMGTGAIVDYQLIPPPVRNPADTSPLGPNAIFVRFRPEVAAATARKQVDQIAKELSLPTNFGVYVLAVQRPAQIVNYSSAGTTPTLLSSALAVGAVSALGLMLVASVRRRRRDLALLKTLGFTQRQLAATVAWQSSIAIFIGTVVGVPTGIVLGRYLWILFAREINAVPAPSVPTLTVALIAVGALLLANVVAAFPGRIAARTSTALVLRAE